VSNLFTDHMVLQHGRPVVVWGTADKGEEVTVSVAGNSVSTRADTEGRWKASPPSAAIMGPT
ncbi:MAG: sialate O-acetylesterase, partial [Pirellulaceae bacterium]